MKAAMGGVSEMISRMKTTAMILLPRRNADTFSTSTLLSSLEGSMRDERENNGDGGKHGVAKITRDIKQLPKRPTVLTGL